MHKLGESVTQKNGAREWKWKEGQYKIAVYEREEMSSQEKYIKISQ